MMHAWIQQTRMEIMRTLRNKLFVLFSVLMPVVFYFIFSSTVGDRTQVGGTDWQAYYLMSMTVFSLISTCLYTFGMRLVEERKIGWDRMMRVAPLRGGVYFTAKMASQSLLNLCIIVVMFVVCGLAKGIHLSASTWILCGLWIWIGVLPFLALGSLIGQSKSGELAAALANILHLGLALLGGLWMPLEIMPEFIQTIGQWTPTYRYGQGAWGILAGNGVNVTGIIVLFAYLLIFVLLSIYLMRRREAAV